MSFSLEHDCLFWRLTFPACWKMYCTVVDRSNETIYNFQTLWNAELHCASLQWLKTSQRVFNFICIATRAKLICKLQFGLARPDFFRFLMVDLMVGCSRLLVLVNDWHVIGAFEPFCSNDTKKFSSASILLGVK